VPLDQAVTRCLAGLVAALVGCWIPQFGLADDIPGDFDFYVLALSWSPSYCEIAGNPDSRQCSEATGFIVHGLWPQYENGYPENCPSRMERWVSGAIVESLRDIMPGGGTVGYQWRKHGLCSGLEQADYFDLVRKAYEKITVPRQYGGPSRDQSSTPGAVEAAFVDANPGLSSGGIAVACKQNALFEVRICLTRDLAFRTCQEVNEDGCRASRISVPAAE
jgi:ribonuclease T2